MAKPERFQQMLQCCVADSKGRTGFELLPYPTADYMWQALQQALKVDIQEIIKEGFQGVEIRHKLNEQRIEQVQEFKEQHCSLSNPTKGQTVQSLVGV